MTEQSGPPPSTPRVLRCGSGAALVELDRTDQVHGLYALLRHRSPRGVLELLPAARTLLVRFDPALTSFGQLSTELSAQPVSAVEATVSQTVDVPVSYDGEDLAEVARLTGLSEAEVVARHRDGRYTVAFCGFAPGFAYLTGLDPALRVPRMDTSRVRVPAGAVAIADEYTAIYPRSSPGGWRLIGHSPLPVWDTHRDPPGLLLPGTTVRFRQVRS